MVSRPNLSELKVFLLREIDSEDSAAHFEVWHDRKCWGISNLDTKISYVVIDRLVEKANKLNLKLTECLSEVSIHELIHQAMGYDYPKEVNNEVHIYALTHILLAYFYLEYIKERTKMVYKDLFPTFKVEDFFKELGRSIIDV